MLRAIHIAGVFVVTAAVALQAVAGDRGAMTVVAEEYIATAAAELRKSFEPLDGRFELQPRGRHAHIDIEAGDRVRLRVRALPNEPSARTVVWIDVEEGQHIVRRVPVHFDVRWLKPALVARHRLAAGTSLLPEMFEQREVDVARYRGDVLTSLAQIEGKRLRRELDSGGVLARAVVEPRPPVAAGERIRVTANVGSIVVETMAIAQRDGFRGDRIGARLLNGGETVRVEIVGENSAKVQEDG